MNELLGPECPCGTGIGYRGCCGPLHCGDSPARSAEALTRSRYAAFACGDADYLFRTWHPRTRPADVAVDSGITWVGLSVIDTEAGGPDDAYGEVEFIARFESGGRQGSLHERSRFARRGGRWLYLDAITAETSSE